jgi:D-alanine-D-alanine ligase
VDKLHSPVAILYQAAKAPVIDGAAKPMKPGGYSDSGADIAFNLRAAGVEVVTPVGCPDPTRALDWVFPDHAADIGTALEAGATVLWANTVLFEEHPVGAFLTGIRLVGQHPQRVQKYDDKWLTNTLLRQQGLPVARALLLGTDEARGEFHPIRFTEDVLRARGFHFPVMLKPVRGRGSQGVVLVHNPEELETTAARLLAATEWIDGKPYPLYGRRLIVEEYLPGDELTLTVMPPGVYEIGGGRVEMEQHWTLPPVRRFGHRDGVAPYSGVVAVVHNSEVLSAHQAARPDIQALAGCCVRAAGMVEAAAPIRIDCRASEAGEGRLFDLNMKPNMTGPGRPGRDDQESLTGLAARAFGWNFPDVLRNMLAQAWRRPH